MIQRPFSMFSWFGYFMPFEERIDLIQEAGFEEVMLSWEDEGDPYAVSREAFPDLVRRRGLEITNFHAPFIGYSTIWENPLSENQTLLEDLKTCISDCRRFQVPTLVVHTVDLELKADHQWENGRAFFSELAEAGEQMQVNIAVENVSRQYLLKRLLDTISSEYFGMCYDTSHDFMLHCGRGSLLKDYADRIKALHISDNDLHIDRHWIPGEGEIPYEQILPAMLQTYQGALSFEVIAQPAWQDRPLDFCRTVRQSLDKYFQRIDVADDADLC